MTVAVELTDPDVARAEARRILRSRDFRAHHPPRPLRGVLEWIGQRFDPVSRAFERVGHWFTHNRGPAVALSILVIAAAVLLGSLVVRRRGLAVVAGDGRGRAGGAAEDPARLERDADAAERSGDHETALRLRFRAGLLRLDRAGILRYRPSLTSGAVMRRVASPSLAALASTLDEVVYGDRPASAGDVEDARRRWPVVLEEASTR